MKTSKTISITIPDRLLERGRAIAKVEGISQPELAQQAYRRCVIQSEYRQLRYSGMGQAKKQGLKPSDVNRMIREYRREQRKNR